jgi:hypothetical protein
MTYRHSQVGTKLLAAPLRPRSLCRASAWIHILLFPRRLDLQAFTATQQLVIEDSRRSPLRLPRRGEHLCSPGCRLSTVPRQQHQSPKAGFSAPAPWSQIDQGGTALRTQQISTPAIISSHLTLRLQAHIARTPRFPNDLLLSLQDRAEQGCPPFAVH